jgi:hypothetical protein
MITRDWLEGGRWLGKGNSMARLACMGCRICCMLYGSVRCSGELEGRVDCGWGK